MPLGLIEATFLGTVLEGVLYGNLYYIYMYDALTSSLGLYFIIFVLYIWVHTSKKCDDRNILIYPISTLFALCTAFFAIDFTQQYLTVVRHLLPSLDDELMRINL